MTFHLYTFMASILELGDDCTTEETRGTGDEDTHCGLVERDVGVGDRREGLWNEQMSLCKEGEGEVKRDPKGNMTVLLFIPPLRIDQRHYYPTTRHCPSTNK